MDRELHLQEKSVKSRGDFRRMHVFMVRQDPCCPLVILLPLNAHHRRCERMVAQSAIKSVPECSGTKKCIAVHTVARHVHTPPNSQSEPWRVAKPYCVATDGQELLDGSPGGRVCKCFRL